MQRHKFVFAAAAICLFLCAAAITTANNQNDDVVRLRISPQTFMEVVGQNNVFPTTNPQHAVQAGYLSHLAGLDNNAIFSGSPKDETTAELTFVNDVLRTQANAIGPVGIVQRDGTFTLYLSSGSASFADLSTFASGTPVLTGTSHQQVIFNGNPGTFSAYTDVTVTSSKEFSLGGTTYQLGRVGDSFRVLYFGNVTGMAVPSALFGGFAVGTGKVPD
jgi:hypothetical protein